MKYYYDIHLIVVRKSMDEGHENCVTLVDDDFDEVIINSKAMELLAFKENDNNLTLIRMPRRNKYYISITFSN